MFKEVGLRNAGIFKAICNEHDGIFYPIDTGSCTNGLDINFLRSYRSSICQMTVDSYIYEGINKAVDEILLSNASDNKKFLVDRFRYKKRENFLMSFAHKHEFDLMYRRSDFDNLEYREIEIEHQRHTCIVSSTFTLDQYNPENPPLAILNVFPYQNITKVVFSSLSSNWQAVMEYIGDILNSHGLEQKRLLSKLILQNCGQIAINPSYWKGKPICDREKIVKYWNETHFWNDEAREDEAFMIF